MPLDFYACRNMLKVFAILIFETKSFSHKNREEHEGEEEEKPLIKSIKRTQFHMKQHT